MGHFFDAFDGSMVSITGGSIGLGFEANTGSQVEISGGFGFVGRRFRAQPDSTVKLMGQSFFIDNKEIIDGDLSSGQLITLLNRDVSLTGVFTNGSFFRFELSSSDSGFNDFFSPDATLRLRLVPLSVTIDTNGDFEVKGITPDPVTQAVAFKGALQINTDDGFTPAYGDTFELLAYSNPHGCV